MSVLQTSATASGGAFTVKLRCNLSSPCEGAFLLCQNGAGCFDDSSPGVGMVHGRIAAGDFVVRAGQTSDVAVGLTNTGKHLLGSSPGPLSGWVMIDLKNYGYSGGYGNLPAIFDEPNGVPPRNNTGGVGDQPWFTLTD